jgi:hypothetical protein
VVKSCFVFTFNPQVLICSGVHADDTSTIASCGTTLTQCLVKFAALRHKTVRSLVLLTGDFGLRLAATTVVAASHNISRVVSVHLVDMFSRVFLRSV